MPQPMTVKELVLTISELIKKGEITDDTPIILAGDEEGNNYNYVYDNISCYDIAKIKDGEKAFVMYPSDSNVEFE